MIPAAYIQEWSTQTPWPESRQVEQDLIICRALCDLFNAPAVADKLAFRGGTAIHKLLFQQPLRYSEDIDLVQTRVTLRISGHYFLPDNWHSIEASSCHSDSTEKHERRNTQ